MGASLVGASAAASFGAFDAAKVNVRVKIAALWASMLFVFVYVDLFTMYRADFRAAGVGYYAWTWPRNGGAAVSTHTARSPNERRVTTVS